MRSELVECDRVYFERLLVGREGVAGGYPQADGWEGRCGGGEAGACIFPLLLATRRRYYLNALGPRISALRG